MVNCIFGSFIKGPDNHLLHVPEVVCGGPAAISCQVFVRIFFIFYLFNNIFNTFTLLIQF